MSRPERNVPRQRGNRGGRRGHNHGTTVDEQKVQRKGVDREAFAKRYQANLSSVMQSPAPIIQRALDEITRRAVNACKVSQKDLDMKGIKRLDHILKVALRGLKSPQLDKFARRALKEKYLLTCQQEKVKP